PAAWQAEKVDVLIQRTSASPQCFAPVCLGELEGALAGAGVAEAPGADRDPGGGGSLRDGALVDDAPVGIQQVECDSAAAIAGAGGPVDPRHRLVVAVAQRAEPAEEPAGQAHFQLMHQVEQ